MIKYFVKLSSIIVILSMIFTSLNVVAINSKTEDDFYLSPFDKDNSYGTFNVKTTLFSDLPNAITISANDPFFALIATPLAVRFDDFGNKKVIPLYVKNLDDPSSSIVRVEEDIGIFSDFVIGDIFTPKEISLIVAQLFWSETTTAMVIKDDESGYSTGVSAAPIASYLGIPIIVTDNIDSDVKSVLDKLGVENIYICGNLHTPSYWTKKFIENEEIIVECLDIISDKFGTPVNYVTITNPADTQPPKVQDSQVVIDIKEETVPSLLFLPTQSIKLFIGETMKYHPFVIPSDYKYARIKVDLENLDYENAENLGSSAAFLIQSPEGPAYYFAGTEGGNPARDADGNLLEDKIHFEFTAFDQAGPENEYTVRVYGKWFDLKAGRYNLKVTIEKLEHPYVPLMEQLSSLAPYITANYKGIIFAKPEFAFAANDDVFYEGQPVTGVSQPGTNFKLLEASNEHTLEIHDELMEILADIANIPVENIPDLREHYANNPIYLTIVGDPTMIPMYFYKNPDNSYLAGLALASDYIYGDIDVDKNDLENDTETYWPFQENMVGRITGRGPEDASALILRTFFYDLILENMDNQEWKDRSLVQTGCGLEFQNLPVLTKIFSHGEEPTKFPTGESEFINLRLKSKMEKGFDNVQNTFWLESQREGFTKQELKLIEEAGVLNKILFPKNKIYRYSGNQKVTGGIDHINSNLIFTFAHGSHQLFEHGDVLMDSLGFPAATTFNRFISSMRSGLSSKGSFSVRAVDGMEYGPSVIFVVSCITARVDGILPENALSQAFIHAGVNTYIGATRFTADPGYLPPRPLKDGVGFGILGLAKAIFDLKIRGKYPEAHFGAVIAEDFILGLIEDDATTGRALRDAKNVYLEKDGNNTFLWTPPLTYMTGIPEVDEEVYNAIENSVSRTESKHMGKKYVALHEFNIYGDPAFNPYQSVNNG